MPNVSCQGSIQPVLITYTSRNGYCLDYGAKKHEATNNEDMPMLINKIRSICT